MLNSPREVYSAVRHQGHQGKGVWMYLLHTNYILFSRAQIHSPSTEPESQHISITHGYSGTSFKQLVVMLLWHNYFHFISFLRVVNFRCFFFSVISRQSQIKNWRKSFPNIFVYFLINPIYIIITIYYYFIQLQ